MKPQFNNKLVAVLNEKIEPGNVMNALAHMCIGLGAELGAEMGKEALRPTRYVDADGGVHPFISEMPFMILKANSNKIRGLRKAAEEEKIPFADFTDTMTVGSYLEQIEKTLKTKEDDLIFYGIVLFGNWDRVSELTKKFSLWK